MAVSQGRTGKIMVRQCAAAAKAYTMIAEMGSWSISNMSRNMIEVSAFKDTARDYLPGSMNAPTITFQGYWDPTNTTGQKKFWDVYSSGVSIGVKSTAVNILTNLRLWANDSTTHGPKGFWSCTGSTAAEIFFTNVQLSNDKNGVGQVTFTAQVSGGALSWCTSS